MPNESHNRSGVAARFLDGIEWVGNKLPDPAVLFLIGALLVLAVSWLAAPSLPEGFELRWTADKANGGVDEHVVSIVEIESGESARFVAVDGAGEEQAARLVVGDDARPAIGDDGQPIDFAGSAWVVFPKRPVEVTNPETGETELELVGTGQAEVAVNLLSTNGLYWVLKSMEHNFMNFAPLGVVLVGILGIGVAEKTGLIAAMLKTFMLVVPRNLLTPTMVFIGIMSSLGSDAGYVVLPPLAAALYLAAGRSPLAGIAAVFAGVAAGFNANLLITTLEPIMANFTAGGAQVIDQDRVVAPTASWYFMAVSTFVISLAGWLTTAMFVEKRLATHAPEDGGPDETKTEPPGPSPWTGAIVAQCLIVLSGIAGGVVMLVGGLSGDSPKPGLAQAGMAVLLLAGCPGLSGSIWALAKVGLPELEARAVFLAMLTLTGLTAITALLVLLPALVPAISATPLSGMDGVFQRWVAVVVPLIFIVFVVPGYVFGFAMGTVKDSKQAAVLMIESIAGMAPIIVLAFFAGQFVAYFGESNLGRMLAYAGGEWLAGQDMPRWMLVVAFIAVTMVFNLFVGSMSAKYALFAPIFVPMFMLIGLRPEMTQVAYRIGDSVTNIITPLNAYLIIILVYMQKYAKNAGMGTLIAMMLPYTIVFSIVWTIMLLVWDALGLPLGLGDPGTVFSPEYLEAHSAASGN